MAYISFNTLAGNWDSRMHELGTPIPMNALMWGLMILDFDGTNKKRLKKYGTTDLKMPFQFMENIPDWAKGANWTDSSDILGRFEPIPFYTSSAAQIIDLPLIYMAEALQAGPEVSSPWTLEWIEQLVKRFQSLVYPVYDGNFTPPPKVVLNIGNIYRDIPLIVKNVTVKNGPPYHVLTGLPMKRQITVSCQVSYPPWQGIGSSQIYTAYEGAAGAQGPDIFAVQTLDQRYLPKNLRSKSNRLIDSPF